MLWISQLYYVLIGWAATGLSCSTRSLTLRNDSFHLSHMTTIYQNINNFLLYVCHVHCFLLQELFAKPDTHTYLQIDSYNVKTLLLYGVILKEKISPFNLTH